MLYSIIIHISFHFCLTPFDLVYTTMLDVLCFQYFSYLPIRNEIYSKLILSFIGSLMPPIYRFDSNTFLVYIIPYSMLNHFDSLLILSVIVFSYVYYFSYFFSKYLLFVSFLWTICACTHNCIQIHFNCQNIYNHDIFVSCVTKWTVNSST